LSLISQLLHRLKYWIEGFAQKPYSTYALFVVAFVESSLFPIAPDFLLIPLCVARPKRALWYALVVALGSTVGAMLGYYIGFQLFDAVGMKTLALFGWSDAFHAVLEKYQANARSALLVAGFLPIPFQVFTLAAGFNQAINFTTFLVATFVGRAVRFFLVGVLLFVFGPKVKELLDRYLVRMTIAVVVLIVVWMSATKLLM
jgi:membrane protein YqaA with SNARE-associated domain